MKEINSIILKEKQKDQPNKSYIQWLQQLSDKKLTDNGLTAEEVKEYYLNSGFPEYEEEPYKSYNDLDWIEIANLNDLER